MTDDKEILLKLLDKHVDLYKFYMEITVKINLFFYGLTGAVVSFYYANIGSNQYIKLSLVVPLVLAALLMVIFIHGSRSLKPIQDELEIIAHQLETYAVIDITSLKLLLQASYVVMAVVMLGLLSALWDQVPMVLSGSVQNSVSLEP